jgi:hypothetical protein
MSIMKNRAVTEGFVKPPDFLTPLTGPHCFATVDPLGWQPLTGFLMPVQM